MSTSASTSSSWSMQHVLSILPPHVRYVEAPSPVELREGEGVVFLAGGIPGCPAWHERAVRTLARGTRSNPLLIVSPARADFPVDNPAAQDEQVQWECSVMRLMARWGQAGGREVTLFWFPKCDPAVTVQPTTLVEYGKLLVSGRPMVVGADRGYPRRDIVVRQARHERPLLRVVERLYAVCSMARRELEQGAARITSPHSSAITDSVVRHVSAHEQHDEKGGTEITRRHVRVYCTCGHLVRTEPHMEV